MADPGRSWDAIVIGEYERAFYGSQYALIVPLFEHYGVQLWIPEAGGQVDYASEHNGLRVSEATGADIEHLGLERGHRTLVITRKGGKVVTIPIAPRTARAIDLAIGERTEGPLFVTSGGRRLDRHGAARVVRRVTRRAEIAKHVGPHTLRHAFITAALDAGMPLRDVQEAASHADPRTTMRYDRARTSLDRHATYIVATYIAGAAR
jgi:integrase/recombinase XerD